MIETIVPRGPYLELFTRVVNWREGWVSAGNEALEIKYSNQKTKALNKVIQLAQLIMQEDSTGEII